MKYKTLIGLLVMSLVLTSTTTVRAQALSVPSWVPAKIEGWTKVYNGTIGSSYDLDLGSANIVKSNWSEIYLKNTSTSISGIVGVLTYEYTQDFFSKAVPAEVKTALAAYSGTIGSTFTGNTIWDMFQWIMGLIGGYGVGTVTDEKANVPNAQGAFSLNLTGFLEGNFYLLYAYKANFAMMVFAMNFEWTLSTLWNFYETDDMAIRTWFDSYVGFLVTAFGSIMTAFAGIATGLGMSSIPETAGGSITPTADVQTSEQDVNSLGNSFAGSLPGGIPGYPVALIGIASLFAVLFIVQKKRKAIVA